MINYNLKDSSTTNVASFNGKFPKKVFYPLKDVFFQEKVSNKISLFFKSIQIFCIHLLFQILLKIYRKKEN